MKLSKKQYRWADVFPCCFIILCTIVMAMNASNNPFQIGNTYTDSSVFHYVARVIRQGGMPYRDTFDHKGPLIYLLDYWGLLINEKIGVWIVELITILITFLYSYKIARILGCNKLCSCITVAISFLALTYFFEGGNFTEEYACAFIIFSLYCFIKFFKTERIEIWELILCGVSFCAVCLLRINMAVLWGVMCIGVLINRIDSKRAKDIWRFIVWFLCGIIILAGPIMVWLIKNNAFPEFINDYFTFNFKYTSDPSRASIRNIVKALAVFSCSPVSIVTIPALMYCYLKERKLIDLLCFITTIISIVAMCISGAVYYHYGMVLVPLTAYAVGMMLSIKARQTEKNKKEMIASFVSFVCCIVLLFSSSIRTTGSSLLRIVKNKAIASDEVIRVVELIRSVTDAKDKITVCGNFNNIYLLSDRDSASKYSYQHPIAKVSKTIKDEYLEDISLLHPKVVVLWKEIFMYDDVINAMKGEYELIETTDSFEIYLNP